jgi:hypothetical protein
MPRTASPVRTAPPVMTASQPGQAVSGAWASTPAPPAADLRFMAWGCGEAAAAAFVGVPPAQVNVSAPGFQTATPLQDLPPRAATAYLGTFV